MGNAEVVQARVELYQPVAPFDTIISRAFGSLTEFYLATKHLLAPKGLLLAMKGPNPEEEVTPELMSVADVDTIGLERALPRRYPAPAATSMKNETRAMVVPRFMVWPPLTEHEWYSVGSGHPRARNPR